MTADPLDDSVTNLLIEDAETVRVPMIWAVEMFPPSYAAQLSRGIRAQGWRDDGFSLDVEPSERVNRARLTGSYSSFRLARLLRSGEPDARFRGYTSARLPNAYRSVEITLVELENSLTAIVAAFELSDAESLALDRILRQPHDPEVRRHRSGGHYLFDRRIVASRRVLMERVRLHTEARSWLARRVPGVFAVESQGRLPVLDLIVTEMAEPFSGDVRGPNNYLTALDLMRRFDLIQSPELPGLYMSEYVNSEGFAKTELDLYSLAGRFGEILDDDDLHFNGRERTLGAVKSAISPRVSLYLSRLGISSLLALKLRQSAQSRDAAHRLHGRRSVRSIKLLREAFLRGSLDTLSIGRSVRDLASDPRAYKWNVVRFQQRPHPRYLHPGEEATRPADQLDYLAEAQLEQADRLVRDDAATREVLGVVAELTASVESMRTQRWGFAVSILSLVVAAFAAIQAIGWAASADSLASALQGLANWLQQTVGR